MFLGVVVLFSSGCRCGVGFCFPFRSFMFSLFRSDFWVVFSLCALFTLGFLDIGCKTREVSIIPQRGLASLLLAAEPRPAVV